MEVEFCHVNEASRQTLQLCTIRVSITPTLDLIFIFICYKAHVIMGYIY